jgi:hypothetical protein
MASGYQVPQICRPGNTILHPIRWKAWADGEINPFKAGVPKPVGFSQALAAWP